MMRKITLFFLFQFLSLFIYSQTVAKFTVDVAKGCEPLKVNFTDASYGGTVRELKWDLAGIPSSQPSVGRSFLNAGKYPVTLTVTFTNGDVRIAYDTIDVYPTPVAEFTLVNLADTAGCAAHKVQFKSLSATATGTITNYEWDFGAGGNNGMDSTPSFTYPNPGVYSVSLIVTNNYGCRSKAQTKFNYVKVYPQVKAAFTITPNVSCDTFLLASFINTTTGGVGLEYLWDFGDSTTYQTTTKDTVKHKYTNVGTYTVKLTAKNASSCTGTATSYVYIGKPKAFMTIPDTVCPNTDIRFTGWSTPAASDYKWIVSDKNSTLYGANPTYNFSTPGTYTVTLIASSGACKDTIKKDIVVKAGPVVNFTVNPAVGCSVPHQVKFTCDTPNLQYKWNFGDGASGTGQSPTHSYTSPGNYNVSLTVTDSSSGCSYSLIKNRAVAIAIPAVDFTYLPDYGCKPLIVKVIPKVTNLLSPITVAKYVWDFGDGTIDTTTSFNYSHTYTSAGTFNIKLKIITSTGCEISSGTYPVVVEDLCEDDGSGGGGGGGGGGFTLGKTCADKYKIDFTDTVKNSKTLEWDFGDGTIVNTGVLNPITHQYTPPQKVYIVIIKRKDTITNVISIDQKKIIIIDEKADFVPDITDICKGMEVHFNTRGIDSSRIKKYTWDYGDSTKRVVIDNAYNYQTTGKYLNGNSSHKYLKNGVFYVKLIIEDKLGCKDSVQYPVPITVQGPIANFVAEPLRGCGKEMNVTFKDTSQQNGTIPIVKWIWNFGDGTVYETTVDTPIVHKYNSGSYYNFYTASLKIVDSIGCESEEVKSNYIKKYYPKAGFYSYDTLLCGRLNVGIYNSSTAYNATYLWDFGDSTVASSYNGFHTYTKDGLYTIKLVVKDENGCKDSITREAFIKIVHPKADFIIGDTTKCAPVSVVFKDSSQYATSYHWLFDGTDGGTAKDPSPHIYGDPGYYKVTLAVKGVNGCVDTATKTIHIRGPIAKLNTGSTQGCVPYSYNISVTGTNIKTYAWDFGDGTPVMPVSDSAKTHIYVNPGKYLPNVILESPEGCLLSIKAKDSIYVDELHNKFSILPYQVCDSAVVQMVAHSTTSYFSSIIKSKWLFGDGDSAMGASIPPHLYKKPGIYSVSLITETKYGCIDTLTKRDSIKIAESPKFKIEGDSLVCLSADTALYYKPVFFNKSDSVYTYQWSIDNIVVSADSVLKYNFRKEGIHEIHLKISNAHQCSGEAKKIIFIDSIKTNFTVSAYKFCGTGSIDLKNLTTSVAGIDTAYWDMGDNTTIGGGKDTAYSYKNAGEYVVKLYASTVNQCKDSMASLVIKVHALPVAKIVGDTFSCNPKQFIYNSEVITKDSIATYSWKLDNAPIGLTKDLLTVIDTGKHIISLNVQTITGCVDSTKQEVVIDTLKADFNVLSDHLCSTGDTVRFKNLSFSHSSVSSYNWYFGDGASASAIEPTHIYSTKGKYAIQLVMVNKNGCMDSVTKSVNQSEKIKIAIQGADELCAKQAINFSALIATDDSVQTMSWKIDSMQAGTAATMSHLFTAPGSYNIGFSVITTKGCKADTSKILTVHALPIPSLQSDTTICKESSVQLNARDGVKYKWLPLTFLSNDTIATPVVTPEVTTQYVVSVTNQYNCESKDSVTVSVDNPIKVWVKDVPPICKGASVRLEAYAENTNKFLWSPATGLSDSLIANPVATPDTTMQYKVTAKSQNVCPDATASIKVVVGENPVLKVKADTAVVSGSTIQLVSQIVNNVPVTYMWKPANGLNCSDCALPIASNIRNDRTYTLLVRTQEGCEGRDTVRIRVFCEDELLIPNAFTPNGDGLNDVFYPQAPGYGIVQEMIIFDRWGEVVFSQKDFPLNAPLYGWNGSYKNGETEASAVFVYKLRLRCADGSGKEIIGKVTLVR